MRLSIIIPARNEIYLERTIKEILTKARGDVEILVMLDGYIPEPQIVTNDNRVVFHHFPESIGQRQCINEGVRRCTGDYVMKLDAHCALDEGFDVKLLEDFEDDWTVVPRMYNLDVTTWTPKIHKVTDYMYISRDEQGVPRMAYFDGKSNKEYKRQPRNDKLIDETMCILGACFVMKKDRFWELGGCDENHGSWGQQGVEVGCKSWLSGGKLMVNKKTWFAHWFRGGTGPGFPYPLSQGAVDRARAYSKDLWLNNKWEKQVHSFEWLIKKFNVEKAWEDYLMESEPYGAKELNKFFYRHIHLMRREPNWRGVRIIKMPTDLLLYSEIIFENKPDFIIDSGTKFGGSALYFQDMLDLVGNGGKVITIDKYPVEKKEDPRITYLVGSSTDDLLIAKIKEMVGDKSVMVVLDSDHSRNHVKWELHKYRNIVTKGQYMVVEDCFDRNGELTGPGEAVEWFLKNSKSFSQTDLDKRYLIGFCRGGWLRRLK